MPEKDRRGLVVTGDGAVPPAHARAATDDALLVGEGHRRGRRYLQALAARLHRDDRHAVLAAGGQHQFRGKGVARAQPVGDRRHRGRVPAGVHPAHLVGFDPQRQGHEPLHPLLVHCAVHRHLVEESAVPGMVARAAHPQVFAGPFRVPRRVGNAVELEVAHDRVGTAGIHHAPHDVQCFQLPGAAVDQVAREPRAALRVPPRAHALAVPQLLEQRLEFPRLTVDVTHDVVSHACIPAAGVGVRIAAVEGARWGAVTAHH